MGTGDVLAVGGSYHDLDIADVKKSCTSPDMMVYWLQEDRGLMQITKSTSGGDSLQYARIVFGFLVLSRSRWTLQRRTSGKMGNTQRGYPLP